MAAATAVQVEGADRLDRTLRAAGADLGDMSAAADRAAPAIATAARSRAPVRTGALVATIQATGDGGDVIVSAGSPRVNYAAVQEYGSPRRHVPAHPYLGPAVDTTEPSTVAAYAAEVDHILRTVKGV